MTVQNNYRNGKTTPRYLRPIKGFLPFLLFLPVLPFLPFLPFLPGAESGRIRQNQSSRAINSVDT